MKSLDLTSPTKSVIRSPTPQTLTVRDLMRHFSTQLPPKSNYVRQARQFVEDCLIKNVPIDQISFTGYVAGKKPHQVSPIRKFVLFYQTIGQPTVLANPPGSTLSNAVDELIDWFLSDTTGLRGEYSKRTYQQALNTFFTFMEAQKQAGRFAQLTASFVETYVNHQKNKVRKLSPFTINLHLSAIKQLAAWCIRRRERLDLTQEQVNDLRDIDAIRGLALTQTYHKESLSAGQRDQLLTGVESARDLAILYLLSYEGLRTVEVCRLQVKDLDFEGQTLHVLGKGKNNTESIKFFHACQQVLKAYLQANEWWPISDDKRNDYLFENDPPKKGPLKTSQIRYIVDKTLRKQGLKKEGYSAHSLRHTVAQLLIEANIPLEYVQQHLRHKKIETTQVYTRKKTQEVYFSILPD